MSIALLSLASVAAGLVLPAGAGGVTLGSDLSKPPISSWGCGGMPCAGVQLSLPGATTVSPVNGTITTFRIRGASGTDTGRLQVVTPNGGGASYTFKAASATVTVPLSTTVSTFTTSLPISKGDLIALDDDHAAGNNFGDAGGSGGPELVFQPLPSAGVPVIPAFNSVGELLFNADVVPTAIFPRPKKPKATKSGAALLTIAAPNPGLLTVGAPGATSAAVASKKKGLFIRPVARLVTDAGDVRVTLRPTKSTRSILRRFGQANGRVQVTFAPTGGSPASQLVRVRLRLG